MCWGTRQRSWGDAEGCRRDSMDALSHARAAGGLQQSRGGCSGDALWDTADRGYAKGCGRDSMDALSHASAAGGAAAESRGLQWGCTRQPQAGGGSSSPAPTFGRCRRLVSGRAGARFAQRRGGRAGLAGAAARCRGLAEGVRLAACGQGRWGRVGGLPTLRGGTSTPALLLPHSNPAVSCQVRITVYLPPCRPLLGGGAEAPMAQQPPCPLQVAPPPPRVSAPTSAGHGDRQPRTCCGAHWLCPRVT